MKIGWQSRKSFKAFTLFVLPSVIFWYVSLWITVWLRSGYGEENFLSMAEYFTPVFLLWALTFYAFRLYEEGTYRSLDRLAKSVFSVLISITILAVVYFYLQPELEVTPRRFLLILILISTILYALWYLVLRMYVFKRLGRKMIFVTTDASTRELEGLMNSMPVGWESLKARNILEGVGAALDERFLVVLSEKGEDLRTNWKDFYSMRSRGASGVSILRAYEVLYGRVPLELVDVGWFLEFFEHGSAVYESIKRLIDFTAGLVLGTLFVVLYPVIFIAIKFTSPGPVIFKQERVGFYGKIFTVYKLRTMSVNPGGVWTGDKDDRITKVGKVLRRLSLDELPQAWNLLKGDMSLVGPRPEQVGITNELSTMLPFFAERLVVKPGITGWAQLHVYANSLEDSKLKLEYDFYYIKHKSFWFDVSIMLKTCYTVVFGQSR